MEIKKYYFKKKASAAVTKSSEVPCNDYCVGERLKMKNPGIRGLYLWQRATCSDEETRIYRGRSSDVTFYSLLKILFLRLCFSLCVSNWNNHSTVTPEPMPLESQETGTPLCVCF